MKFPHVIVIDDHFHEWRTDVPAVVSMDCGELQGDVLPGSAFGLDIGATLYLANGDEPRSAEWFPDVSTATARLAAVLRTIEHTSELRHPDPAGFLRWAGVLFDQTVGHLARRK